MATATESRRSSSRNTSKDPIEQSRALAREAGQDAQDAVSRSIKVTIDTMTNLSEVGQQVSRHVLDLSLASTQEAMRLWPEISSSVLDGFRNSLGSWPVNSDAVDVWQRVLDGGTEAFSRYTKTVQDTADEGTERINQAVSSLADRVHDATREVGELGDKIEQNRNGRSNSRSPAGAGSPSN